MTQRNTTSNVILQNFEAVNLIDVHTQELLNLIQQSTVVEASPSREYSAVGTGIERKATLINKKLSEQLLEVQTDKEEDESKDFSTSVDACDEEQDEDFTQISTQINNMQSSP